MVSGLPCSTELLSSSSAAGWAAYVKTSACSLMRQLGISFDTIIHPELLKLVLFRHAWVQPTEEVEFRDTAAMMIVVLPSQLKVDFRINPTGAGTRGAIMLSFIIISMYMEHISLSRLVVGNQIGIPCAYPSLTHPSTIISKYPPVYGSWDKAVHVIQVAS